MPLLRKENIITLLNMKQHADACCFYGKPLPLYLSINKKIIETIEFLIKNNIRSLKKFLHSIKTIEINIYNKKELIDMNTPSTWVHINKLLK
jgi:molybdopterin-guanine dinucleotide biosynthesis protein A